MLWSDLEDIVEALEDYYPEENIENMDYSELHDLIVQLLDFDDDPEKSNDSILESIHTMWLEKREEKDL